MHSEREFDEMNVEAEMFVIKMLQQFDADYYGKRMQAPPEGGVERAPVESTAGAY